MEQQNEVGEMSTEELQAEQIAIESATGPGDASDETRERHHRIYQELKSRGQI